MGIRVLIVCSGNAPGFDFRKNQAFVYDQVEALKKLDPGLEFDYFFVKGKGLTGYLSCWKALKKTLEAGHYDCIHAHVTLSGLLANLQRRVPVMTTFHGSDINEPLLRMVSMVVEALSRRTIYISHLLRSKAILSSTHKQAVIPCGVDFELFRPRDKAQSRRQLGLSPHKRYILFASGFDIALKNYPLARAAVNQLQDDNVELMELKNYTREEVALLFTAVDLALMTSFTEGSPQFVKEALASCCPVVSTDVGDVRTVMGNVPGCYIVSYDAADVAEKIRLVLASGQAVASREAVADYDNRLIATRVRNVYYQLFTGKKSKTTAERVSHAS